MGNFCLTTGKVCATINDDCHKIVTSNKMAENLLKVNGRCVILHLLFIKLSLYVLEVLLR